MRYYLHSVLRIGLASFLILSSLVILYTTAKSTQSAQSLADQALESTALALSASAESALRAGISTTSEEIREIFPDRVVAYALIAAPGGKILFHTNPRLVGTHLEAEEPEPKWPSKTASGRRITLGTGLPAYEFNHFLHRPDGSPELLRLVLHTTPADRIVSDARRLWWTVGGVLALLWGAGILSERLFTRYLRLQEDLEQRKQMALIGQMTAVLAHEIRNALGSIKGYAQWVDEKTEVQDPKKGGLAAILQGTGRIESLTDELLLFSREETFRVEGLDFESLVREAIDSAVPPWKGRVEVEVQAGTRVRADREKLFRVLVNGIRNAIESMGDEGSLRLSARSQGRLIIFQIGDTGPGIPEGEIPRLFTPFHTTKPDGTGLGLAYSKKVVEGMGGKIYLANRENSAGAILTILLPRTGE